MKEARKKIKIHTLNNVVVVVEDIPPPKNCFKITQLEILFENFYATFKKEKYGCSLLFF